MPKAVNFRWFGGSVLNEFVERAERIIPRMCVITIDDIKTAMLAPKHGRVYTKHGHTWKASAPGESPAVFTGKLIDSLSYETETRAAAGGGVTVVGRIGTLGVSGKQNKYMLWMELGTPGGKVAPRPYLRPRLPFAMKQTLKEMLSTTAVSSPTSEIKEVL